MAICIISRSDGPLTRGVAVRRGPAAAAPGCRRGSRAGRRRPRRTRCTAAPPPPHPTNADTHATLSLCALPGRPDRRVAGLPTPLHVPAYPSLGYRRPRHRRALAAAERHVQSRTGEPAPAAGRLSGQGGGPAQATPPAPATAAKEALPLEAFDNTWVIFLPLFSVQFECRRSRLFC